jgi:hypothetical protein
VRTERHLSGIHFDFWAIFCLVYDQTIPFATAQLQFTVGVTCALAFELPNVPLHNITETLRQNLQMKLHPEQFPTTTEEAPAADDDDDHGGGDDHDHESHNNRIDSNYKDFKYIDGKQSFYNMMNKHNFYYSKNGFKDKSDNQTALTGAKNDDLRKIVKT